MRAIFPLLPMLALTACAAGQGSFPSLAPRPAERALGAGPAQTGPCAVPANPGPAAPAAPAPVADDTRLRSRIEQLRDEARRGEAAFSARRAAASAAIGRAGPNGSESWIAAQTELSRLEAARVATLDALSALEALLVERARAPTSAADLDLLDAAARQVRAFEAEQRTELDRLAAILGGNRR